MSEPPRGRRWETDLVIQIGLRMLTHQVLSRTDDQQYLTSVLGKIFFFVGLEGEVHVGTN